MMGDFMTIKEHYVFLEGLKLIYIGDGRNNSATSLLVTARLLGVHITIAAPESLMPDEEYIEIAKSYAKEPCSEIVLTDESDLSVKDANIVYTDVWISMGEEKDAEKRLELLEDYQVNEALLENVDDN